MSRISVPLHMGKKELVLKKLHGLLKKNNYEQGYFFRLAITNYINQQETCIAKIYIGEDEILPLNVTTTFSISPQDATVYNWYTENYKKENLPISKVIKAILLNSIELVDSPEKEELPNNNMIILKNQFIFKGDSNTSNPVRDFSNIVVPAAAPVIVEQPREESKDKTTSVQQVRVDNSDSFLSNIMGSAIR